MIHQFVKKNVRGRKQIIGVLVADQIDGEVRYGWSKTDVKKGDVFNPQYGMNLATSRMRAKNTVPIPSGIFKDAVRFERRCKRYFKNAQFLPLRKKLSVEGSKLPYDNFREFVEIIQEN